MKKLENLLMVCGGLIWSLAVSAQEEFDIEAFAHAFMAAEKAAWERDEFDALQALEHADVVFNNINGSVMRGWEAHKQAIIDSYKGASITQEWRYLMGEGNMFTVAYTWQVQFPKRTLEVSGIAVGRVSDGKLIEEWGAGSVVSPPAKE